MATERHNLFCFFIYHMTAHEWVVFLQLQAGGVITAVFVGDIDMTAFRTTHFNNEAIAFFAM